MVQPTDLPDGSGPVPHQLARAGRQRRRDVVPPPRRRLPRPQGRRQRRRGSSAASTRPESLTVLNDPVVTAGGSFRGQHDARVLSDGTVTVHDNGFHPTPSGRRARSAMPSTQTRRPRRLSSRRTIPGPFATPVCCGSARKLAGGNWLMSWGSTGVITELSPSGSRVFKLTFDDELFSYRVPSRAVRDAQPAPRCAPAWTRSSRAAIPRSKSAGMGQPLQVSLVPAFKPCVSPDRTHGPPLASPSCSAPALASDFLTVGTNDANGARRNSTGFVVVRGTAWATRRRLRTRPT